MATIRFTELREEEKERWRRFLIDNPSIRFRRVRGTEDGNPEFEAEIELWPPGRDVDEGRRRRRSMGEKTEEEEEEEEEEDNKRGATPPSVHLNHLQSCLLEIREKTRENLEPLPHYALFVALLAGSRLYQPRKKSKDYVLNKINEMYQKYLTASRRRASSSSTASLTPHHHHSFAQQQPLTPNSNSLFAVFPIFVYDEFCKAFGLRSLSHAACWDFVFSVHALRKEIKVVEMFASFLEEKYEPPELDFYLDAMIRFGHLGEIPRGSFKSILVLAKRHLQSLPSASANHDNGVNLNDFHSALDRLATTRRDDVMEVAVEIFRRRRNLVNAEIRGGEASPSERQHETYNGAETSDSEASPTTNTTTKMTTTTAIMMLRDEEENGGEPNDGVEEDTAKLEDLEERLGRTLALLEKEKERAREMGAASSRTPPRGSSNNKDRPSTLMKMTASAKMKRKSTGGS